MFKKTPQNMSNSELSMLDPNQNLTLSNQYSPIEMGCILSCNEVSGPYFC